MSSSSPYPPSAWGPLVRDLKSRVDPIGNGGKYVQQSHENPYSPVAHTCLWEAPVYESMKDWFNRFKSSGFGLQVGIVAMTKGRVVARFRVGVPHQQPFGLLHGGVSALIAEELGSIASSINAAPRPVVGVNLSATHLAGATVGQVVLAICEPLKQGGTLQVWETLLFVDEEQTDVSEKATKDPLHYLKVAPTGKLLAKCQLTTMARSGPGADKNKPNKAAVPSKL